MASFTGGITTLSGNGNVNGVCSVTSATFLVPNATVYLSATGLPTLEMKISHVIGTSVALRLASAMPTKYGTNISAYTTALSASLYMPTQNVWGNEAVAGGVAAVF